MRAGMKSGWRVAQHSSGRGRGGAVTWEKMSTLCPCSFSLRSIFCSSRSFPEDLISAPPS